MSEAKESGNLMECVCCCDEECLVEDMLPCGGGHLFCKDCVQRASEVSTSYLLYFVAFFLVASLTNAWVKKQLMLIKKTPTHVFETLEIYLVNL